VLATGPFASASRRAWAPGAALVGDAADFFDPFTGEGIYAALRGAELLTPSVLDALASRHVADADAALRDYDRCRIREFRG
jgi:flavin-dependent dehydrogenase